MMRKARWYDTSERYGLVSRAFHWLMATLFGWQFAGALLFVTVGDSAVTRFFGRHHFDLGFVLFVLVLFRGIWGLLNLHRRPPHPGRLGTAAAAGHAFIYLLMICVPGMALLRQYGSGEAFSSFGVPILPHRGTKIEWMMAPANLLHYWLGFVLLAVIVGHIAMSFVHRRLLKEDVLQRMI